MEQHWPSGWFVFLPDSIQRIHSYRKVIGASFIIRLEGNLGFSGTTHASELSADQIVWKDVPKGVWFNKIPYLWPVNAPDIWLLNISKFKAHGMGMTLCDKNMPGTIAMDYQAHCTAFGSVMNGVDPAHIRPSANYDITTNYNRHKAAGIPRWDRPGSSGGIWIETWASRCLDNNSVNLAGLHIIEGIYGRDGNFLDGPHEGKLAADFMTNYIIFGRNQFHVDNIGHYPGGHEPGNFGLFHMAKERGMAKTINPADIPLYEWDASTGPSIAQLTDFQRFPLLTYYLQRNYGGQTEPYWHMVDETYVYDTTGLSGSAVVANEFYMKNVFPNPLKDTGTLRFYVPRYEHVSVEMVNSNGQVVEVLFDRQIGKGNHTVNINCSRYSSGLYIARMQFKGLVKTHKLRVTG